MTGLSLNQKFIITETIKLNESLSVIGPNTLYQMLKNDVANISTILIPVLTTTETRKYKETRSYMNLIKNCSLPEFKLFIAAFSDVTFSETNKLTINRYLIYVKKIMCDDSIAEDKKKFAIDFFYAFLGTKGFFKAFLIKIVLLSGNNLILSKLAENINSISEPMRYKVFLAMDNPVDAMKIVEKYKIDIAKIVRNSKWKLPENSAKYINMFK